MVASHFMPPIITTESRTAAASRIITDQAAGTMLLYQRLRAMIFRLSSAASPCSRRHTTALRPLIGQDDYAAATPAVVDIYESPPPARPKCLRRWRS